MSATAVCIAAARVRTPVGAEPASVAAAMQAGIVALKQHPFMIDQAGAPMPGALDPDLDPRVVGTERMFALAETSLREACSLLTPKAIDLSRIHLFLALPEIRPGFSVADVELMQSRLTAIKGLPGGSLELTVFPNGHAAGFLALAAATKHLRQGKADACLLGGVDSYFHPDTMEWLDDNRQLAGAVSRSGFIPGEGAAFCVLLTGDACRRHGMRAPLQVRTVTNTTETKVIKAEDVCTGEGLSAAVRVAIGDLHPSKQTINDIICDINGERYRGEEWGFVCLRLGHFFDDPTDYLCPAQCWGDVGAASGPLFAMLASEAARRGYAKGPRTLLWASSERGDRGVAVLEPLNALGERGRTL